MSHSRDAALDALLGAARVEFRSSFGAKAANLEALAGRGAWDEVRRAAHKLRGSAGVYGFDDLGAAAARLEDRLLAEGSRSDPASRSLPDSLARALVDELRRASGEGA
jgi:HPt (histidine-containing phosphotransfer) domain-containing protein